MLLQMLAVDPSRRIRLGAIKSHPWFQELPQYLLLLRPAAAAAATPDALVLNQMAKVPNPKPCKPSQTLLNPSKPFKPLLNPFKPS